MEECVLRQPSRETCLNCPSLLCLYSLNTNTGIYYWNQQIPSIIPDDKIEDYIERMKKLLSS